MNPLGVQDSEKGEEGANLPSPGFAGDAAKQAAKAYRNGTSAATFPAIRLSRPTRVSQWGRNVPARQQSMNPFPAMARRLKTDPRTLGVCVGMPRLATDPDSRESRDQHELADCPMGVPRALGA